MSNSEEFSESGAPIYRHTRTKEFTPAFGETSSIEAIVAHIEKHIGKISTVFHEVISDLVHIDVHCVQPTPERNFYTLITSGMSDLAMAAPEGEEEFRFAELMLCLPPNWPVSEESFKDENVYWPVRWLKNLAKLPHEFDSWLCWGHTVPNGDPPQRFATGTKFSCMLVADPITVEKREEFYELKIDDSKTIFFFSVLPLYKEETDFKLKYGAEDLLDRLHEAGVTEVIDVNRKNVCKRSFWPFR